MTLSERCEAGETSDELWAEIAAACDPETPWDNPFTSIDAAAKLASPDWAVCKNGDREGWQAMDFAGGKVWCDGATPAMALCAAALKARGL